MKESIFRAYSIRGIAGETLTVADMELIGRAVGTILGYAGHSLAAIGRDHRVSSPELASALIAGLSATGMNVIDIGACSTPLLNFAVDHYRAGTGLMVTASHNPPAYNGLKIRTDHTLQGIELHCIYQVARQGVFRRGQGTVTTACPLDDYLDAIVRRVQVSRSLRCVVDGGNGAAGLIVLTLLERLGCQPIPLYCEPDGTFPNRTPDPTAIGALDDLRAHVLAKGADAGLAYDGDGDRLVMVDDTGRVTLADRLLALLARQILAERPGAKVVYELSCTQALPEIVAAMGGQAIACPVGYAFVHQTFRRAGAALGGEAAGHLFFDEPGFQFDDATLATAKIVALLSSAEKPLSALLAELPQYVASPQYRFHCPEELKGQLVARVSEEFVAAGYTVERMDGAKVFYPHGWALFRASNTQPAVTLRCEAKTAQQLAEVERNTREAIRTAMEGLGIEMSAAQH